jgi:DNA polymerase-4
VFVSFSRRGFGGNERRAIRAFGRMKRVYCHLDVNAFYASVEEARLFPALVGKPVAVAQRTLLVTTNHTARALGVPKMCTIVEGKRLVPSLVVIDSDMSRYRLAHRQLFDLLREMGLAPERASIDEAYLDLTPLLDSVEPGDWARDDVVVLGGPGARLDLESEEDAILARGVVVANMIRSAIREKMRFETSAGVSLNKSFAKHASGLHKPSRTSVVPVAAHEGLLQLAPEKLNGIGPAVLETLREICATRLDYFVPETLQHLQRLQRHELEVLGATGAWIYQLCRGIDTREVKDKGPPGSFGFQAAHRERIDSLQQLYGVILSKSEQMAARLEEDEALYQRSCRTLSVSFRFEGKTVTRACAMPAAGEQRASEICDAAMQVIANHAKKDASVVQSQRFGLTATNFTGEGSMAEQAISAFLVAGAEVDWSKVEAEVKPPPTEGPMKKFAVKNAPVDWGSAQPKEPVREDSIARFVVAKGGVNWEGASAAAVVKKAKKEETKKKTRSVADMMRVEGEACPVCSAHVATASLNAHVNRHFEEEKNKAEKKTIPPPTKKIRGALDKFLAQK